MRRREHKYKINRKILLACLVWAVALFAASVISLFHEAAHAQAIPQACESITDQAKKQSCAQNATSGSGQKSSAAGTVHKDIETKCNDAILTRANCPIVDKLIIFINVLSALVGIVVVIMIVIGGIQYSSSADNPQATAAAKSRIFNAILALVLYLFLFAFLQWVVPGGIF